MQRNPVDQPEVKSLRRLASTLKLVLLVIFGNISAHSLLLLALLFAPPSGAQSASSVRCSALFDIQPESPARLMDLLNQRKLKAQGFEVDEQNYLIDLKTKKKVGRLLAVDPPYLYEWADLDYQKIWVYNGGLSEADVDVYLRSPPQNYGRGYYVSTSPYDSTTFGDALTVFITKGPILLIEYQYNPLHHATTELMRRLRDAGIDGIRGNQTWYAMINGKHLKIPKGVIDDPQFRDTQLLKDISSEAFAGRLEKSGFLKQLSPDSPFRKLANLHTVEGFKEALTIADERMLPSLVNVIRDYRDQEIEKLLAPPEEFSLRSVLPFFEIASLHQIMTGGTSEISNLTEVAEASKKQMARRARIKLESVHTFLDFVRLAPLYLGQKSEIRQYSAMMSSPTFSTPEEGMKPLDSVLRNQLARVPALTISDDPKTNHTYIEYLTIERVQRTFRHLLPPRLKTKLEKIAKDYDLSDPGLLRHKEVRHVFRESLESLTSLLFTGTSADRVALIQGLFGQVISASDIQPYLLYRAFMVIHPFENGNGRLGRLYFEWASMKMEGKRSVLELADFDMDAFMSSRDLSELHLWTRVINTWVAQAQNEKELLLRIEAAMRILKRRFPILETYWNTEQER